MNKESLKQFFSLIFPDLKHYVELRYKTRDGKMHQKFYRSVDEVVETLVNNEEFFLQCDVWFGVAERLVRKGTKDAVASCSCLWVDVDDINFRIPSDFPLQPHIIVFSGHGYHIYWLIETQKINSPQDIEVIEQTNRGLALYFNGDATHDIARILRVPYTFNRKNDKPVQVEIKTFIDEEIISRYKIEDFEEFRYRAELESEETPKVFVHPLMITETEPFDIKEITPPLPYWCERAILHGYDPAEFPRYKSRSELDLAVMLLLLQRHLTDEQIISIFMNPKYGISAKTLEKKGRSALQYLELTLSKAKKKRDEEFNKWLERRLKMRDFNEVIQIYKKWFHIEDDDYLRIIHAILISHLFDAKPLWLLAVAPPSGTKTSILQDLKAIEKYNVRLVSELTSKTFVSGDKNYSGLLFKIKNGVLIFKDFTSILQLESSTRNVIFQQLREIWDGYYKKEWGINKEVVWEGKITILAGCTDVYETFRELEQAFGERFLIYRPEIKNREQAAHTALQQIWREQEKSKEIQEAIINFHTSVDVSGCENILIPQYLVQRIVTLSDIVTLFRTGVSRNHKGEVENVSSPEIPARLAQQLYTLMLALGLLNRGVEVTEKEYKIVERLSTMTIPVKRYQVLKYYQQHNYHGAKINDIAEELSLPYSTVHRVVEDLWCLGIMDKRPSETWKIKDEIIERIEKSGILREE